MNAYTYFFSSVTEKTIRKGAFHETFVLLSALFLFCLFLILPFSTGCGKQEEANASWQGIPRDMEDMSLVTNRSEYYDISATQQPLDSAASSGVFLGAQFYQGEPIELRMETLPDEENLYRTCLCVRRMDGSREILLYDLSYQDFDFSRCYLDQDGSCYCWINSYIEQRPDQPNDPVNTTLTKYRPTGEIEFVKEWNDNQHISDLRQLPDGTVYLLVEDSDTNKKELLKLDTRTGETTQVTEAASIYMGQGSRLAMGESGGFLALYHSSIFDERDFIKLNPEDGSQSFLFSLNGTSYMPPSDYSIQDFQILDNGSMEILWAKADSHSPRLLETLQMTKIDQTPILLRGSNISSWLLNQINLFNQNNENYHIIPESCGTGNDLDDFARLTSIQLGAGRGPDILYGNFMQDYLTGMMQKGILEDISPYLENSGIRKEDYFPLTFNSWCDGDKIYGINVQCPFLVGFKSSKTLLGNLSVPAAEPLIDALLTQKENFVYLQGYDSKALLNLFLSGSETLLGMVDWENGNCNFRNELFQKLLEAAKRFGDDGKSRQESYPAEEIDYSNIFFFDSQTDLEKSGMVQTGTLFDDGCYPAIYSSETLAVNANSSVKEGAWEFISFLLLNQEDPSALEDSLFPPIRKDAFDLWIAQQRTKVSDGKTWSLSINMIERDGSLTTIQNQYTEDDIRDEKVKEYKKALEEARPCPLRTVPVLNIILKESEFYFNGSKTAEEVSAVIHNRVQLYLEENR